MKRRREMEKGSEIKNAIEEMSMMVKLMNKPLVLEINPATCASSSSNSCGDDGVDDKSSIVPTRPFLSICYLLLHLLDKIGPTMAVLRQDIDQNIQRIEMLYEIDHSVYSNMVEMLKKEKSEGIAKKGQSCSKAFVWLIRSLDFGAALMQRVLMDGGENNIEKIVEESYTITLRPWHGWISSAAYKVALKLVPDRNTLIDLLTEKGVNSEAMKGEMQSLILLLVPYLQDINSILRIYGLDSLKSS